jgi:Leucine-rich repeat (LRR) protein
MRTNVPKLAILACNRNQLTELDLSSVPELAKLFCDENQLTELDVRQNRKLKVFKCDPLVSIKKLPSQVLK